MKYETTLDSRAWLSMFIQISWKQLLLKSELVVVNIFDEHNRPVDGVESQEKYWNEDLSHGLHLNRHKISI